MIKSQMFIAVALLVGVAIGYVAADRGDKEAKPQTTTVTTKKTIADVGESSSNAALRRRIAELEQMLAEKKPEETPAEKLTSEITNMVGNAKQQGGMVNSWIENLKKTDPQRYTQMTNRFAQWRKQRMERAQESLDFLSSIDVSHMSEKAQKTHADLQDLIARREEIEAELHQENLSDERRGELMGELRDSHGEMNRLNKEERNNLLRETARNLGFKGDEAKEIVSTVQEIIKATDSGFGGHRRGPGGGHRGR